jgi:hypothetical protein
VPRTVPTFGGDITTSALPLHLRTIILSSHFPCTLTVYPTWVPNTLLSATQRPRLYSTATHVSRFIIALIQTLWTLFMTS